MDSILLVAFGLVGAVLASFIGVIAERHNTGESWVAGRSRCNSCSVPLHAQDLVPIVSWLSSKGRCRTCGSRIPGGYVVAEAVFAVLFMLSYLSFGLSFVLLSFLASLSVLLFIVLYDLRHTVVPMGAAVLFVLLALAHAVLSSPDLSYAGLSLLMAGMIGFAFFLFFALSKGRAMGLGDSPVALGLALLAGFSASLPGLLFSFWIGALIGIVILVSRPQGHRMGIEVPFVPFLAAGYLLAIFTGWNPFFLALF